MKQKAKKTGTFLSKTSGFDGQLHLVFPGRVTGNGLIFEKKLPYKQWAPVGMQLRRAKDWVNFGIGDWLNHGEGEYGEDYTQAAGETGMPPETLMVLKSIAGAVPENIRVVDKLSWSHHRLVAPVKYLIPEKVGWLQKAIDNDWGVREMNEAMNPPKSKDAKDDTISSGCECCGTTPAGMKTCAKCASVASTAIDTVGVKGAIELMKRKPSKPQLEMLAWALENIREPKFRSDEDEIDWQARFDALKLTVEKAAKKAA